MTFRSTLLEVAIIEVAIIVVFPAQLFAGGSRLDARRTVADDVDAVIAERAFEVVSGLAADGALSERRLAFGEQNRGGAGGPDPRAVETELGLERPMRRLIQQGLRAEGFDAGVPDGLFGPVTRAAIRRWQASRGAPTSGYLDGTQAEALRAAGAPQPASEVALPASPPFTETSVVPAQAQVNCEAWNKQEFFETSTAEVATACLAAGADVAARADDGHTPLHMAAEFNENPTVIDVLVAAGADVEARDDDEYTPLQRAASSNGNPAVLEALVEAGADLKQTRANGRTLLSLAAERNPNPAMIEALVTAEAERVRNSEFLRRRHSSELTQLLYRVAERNPNPAAVIEVLVAAGADVAERNIINGRTPLHFAAGFSENPAVIEALVAAGADVAAQNVSSETPLHFAARRYNENPAVIEAVIEAGADVNARDHRGRTALHVILAQHPEEVVSVLGLVSKICG